MNEDRELYVDLQLDDWIQPDDDFPVGVTTWKILQEDWWQQSWIILNWKTTSWDYVRLIYANDGKLYYDPGTWTWIEIWTWWGWIQINVATASTLWLIKLGTDTQQVQAPVTATSISGRTYPVQLNADNQAVVNIPWENTEYESLIEEQGGIDESLVTTWEKYIWNHKQDWLTAWTNITIDQNNVISAIIPSALIYKWNVTNVADLPSSWQTVGDTYFVEWADAMYSWDWNQWNYVGGTGISLTDYFNMTVNTSDDITEWTTNLFVTQIEKNTWNNKQDQLTAWDNIQISNNVISATDTTYTEWDWIEITNQNVINNTAKFDPDNAGSLGQFLKKTNNGYAWADIPWWWGGTSYTAWDGIDITNNVISATDRFTPTNQWSIGQVLKKSGANTYYWANESWGQWNFNPENPWTTGQVLTKTATWYDWETIAGGEWNVKLFTLSSTSDTATAQAILDWYNQWKLPIIKYYTTVSYRDADWVLHQVTWDYIYIIEPYYDSPSVDTLHFITVETANNGSVDNVNWWTRRWIPYVEISYQDGTVSTITAGTQSEARLDFIAPNVDYTNPYMPIYAWSPATKAYVDSRNWVGTLSEYNAIVDKDPNVFYNITSLS